MTTARTHEAAAHASMLADEGYGAFHPVRSGAFGARLPTGRPDDRWLRRRVPPHSKHDSSPGPNLRRAPRGLPRHPSPGSRTSWRTSPMTSIDTSCRTSSRDWPDAAGLTVFWGTTGCSLRMTIPGRNPLSAGRIFPPGPPRWMGLVDVTVG
jgi:hypothetical protein